MLARFLGGAPDLRYAARDRKCGRRHGPARHRGRERRPVATATRHRSMIFEAASDFRVERLGVIMRPDPNREEEIEGVLNPGSARGPDGELYLFPRLVGRNNYSR